MTKKIKSWFSLCTGILCVFFIVSSCSDNDEILPDDDTPGMVKDIEGNEYRTVKIGDQIWMAENLRTTKYNDGISILNFMTNEDWREFDVASYVWYDNDIGWKGKYGALYNGFAISNEKELCPVGWHVPTDEEWTELLNYVVNQGYPNNGNDVNGSSNALKSCRQVSTPLGDDCITSEHPRWDTHGIHYGTDAFGFSSLPGGIRLFDGLFYYLGKESWWWSSTEFEQNQLFIRTMSFSTGGLARTYAPRNYGFAVRCIKD